MSAYFDYSDPMAMWFWDVGWQFLLSIIAAGIVGLLIWAAWEARAERKRQERLREGWIARERKPPVDLL